MAKNKVKAVKSDYSFLVQNISSVLEEARKTSARAVNAILTATYWQIGRIIVEYEYQGMDRVEYYGDRLIDKLAEDLTKRFGKGFSRRNVFLMKSFFLEYKNIIQTPSVKSSRNIVQTLSAQSSISNLSDLFPLPWSHYVKLLTVKNEEARRFYETKQ
jgi:hypothetical protein